MKLRLYESEKYILPSKYTFPSGSFISAHIWKVLSSTIHVNWRMQWSQRKFSGKDISLLSISFLYWPQGNKPSFDAELSNGHNVKNFWLSSVPIQLNADYPLLLQFCNTCYSLLLVLSILLGNHFFLLLTYGWCCESIPHIVHFDISNYLNFGLVVLSNQ